MNNQTKAYTYAALTILFWGTAATAFKLALHDLTPLELLVISNLVAFAILSSIVIFRKKTGELIPKRSKDLGMSLLLGFLNPFAYYLVLFEAYSRLPAQLAQPLNFVWPIALVLLSVPLLRQSLNRMDIVALLVSFLGVYLLSSQGNPLNFVFADGVGIMLALFSSVIWALFWLLNVKDQRDAAVKLCLNFFFSLLFVIPLALAKGVFPISLSFGFGAAVYVGFFEMGITFVLWLQALKYARSTAQMGNIIYITPFVALFFVHVVLHERIYYTTFLGLFLIIAGILTQRKYGTKHG